MTCSDPSNNIQRFMILIVETKVSIRFSGRVSRLFFCRRSSDHGRHDTAELQPSKILQHGKYKKVLPTLISSFLSSIVICLLYSYCTYSFFYILFSHSFQFSALALLLPSFRVSSITTSCPTSPQSLNSSRRTKVNKKFIISSISCVHNGK